MAQRTSSNSLASLVLIALLFGALFLVKRCRKTEPVTNHTEQRDNNEQQDTRGLNRHPSAINYSKHARCRMDCRHISEAEVQDILASGRINYRKSEIGDNPDCHRKYALEGETTDGQRVRIIFAPCASEVTVVTVIDLGKEWECDCQ